MLSIHDDLLEKVLENYLKEEERKMWGNLKYKEEFISLLIELLNKNGRVVSEDFLYAKEELPKPFSKNMFEEYCFSLFDFVNDYGKKYYIPENIEESYFVEASYGLLLKNNYYSIELISGQGSYVAINKLKEKEIKNLKGFVDYDLALIGKSPENFTANIKEELFTDISEVINKYEENGISKKLLKKILTDIISEINND